MFKLSRHATARSQQRGFTNRRLQALWEHVDLVHPIGSNCSLLKVSSRAAKNINGFDGLERFALIQDDRTGDIRTILCSHSGRRGRRYRRGR